MPIDIPMRGLLLPLGAAYAGVLALFLGERAERTSPTFSVGGGFVDVLPDISTRGLAMHGGYYAAILVGAATVAVELWRGTRVDRLTLAIAPIVAAVLLVGLYWPPLTAEAYGGHADDYTERPFPFPRERAFETLERERASPDRAEAALGAFAATGVTPLQLVRALEQNGIATNPVDTTYTDPPRLLRRTLVPFFASRPVVDGLHFVVYRDEKLAAAQLEDARHSNHCHGVDTSAFARHANVVAVVYTCQPGRPLSGGLEPAGAVLRAVGAATVTWLAPLPGPTGRGGLYEPSALELLEQDAEKAAALVRERLGIDLQIWNFGGTSAYLRPVDAGRHVEFELVVSADAATTRDLVEHNYLSAILDCRLDKPRPLSAGRVILRAAQLPSCRPWTDQAALVRLVGEISGRIG